MVCQTIGVPREGNGPCRKIKIAVSLAHRARRVEVDLDM
jgi:hypothetical protein